MSFAEILAEIPKLTVAEREVVAQTALSVGPGLTQDEEAILDARMRDFEKSPDAGVPLEDVGRLVRERLAQR